MKALIDLLRYRSLEAVNIDSNDRLVAHSQVYSDKGMLREVFSEFHSLFRQLDDEFLDTDGVKVEIGAGIAPMRDSYPDVLATDIVCSSHLDLVLNAEDMALQSESVQVLFGQNCFHHFPNPGKFFEEAERVLAPGGGVILIDPYYGLLASFLYKRLSPTEGFDKRTDSWEASMLGPMNGANQALSYLVFVRDRSYFERKYPKLKIVYQKPMGNYLKYILSGGLNFKQLIPDRMSLLVDLIQLLLRPFNRWFALHHVIVIRTE